MTNLPSTSPPAPGEQAVFKRPEQLPGVEMLRARFVRQTFARHFHECYALGVIEQGALGFRYQGEHVVAPAGAVNLTVPGEPHTGHAETGQGWSYRMFYLDPDLLVRTAREMGRTSADLPHFRNGVLDDPLLARRIHRLHDVIERGAAPRMAMETGLMRLLSLWIKRHAQRRPPGSRIGAAPAMVDRIRELIRQRCHEDLSLDDLAREAGLSPFHLVRTFGKHMGLPPHEYLLQCRVEQARTLLRDFSITDTALALGFADQSHLTRQFKRVTGITPGAWRKILQDGGATPKA